MKKVLSKILDSVRIDVFPNNYTCIICDCELDSDKRYCICDKCIKSVPFITDKFCIKCGAKVIADSLVCSDCKTTKRIVDRNVSAVTYSDNMRKLIHEFKYNGKKYLAQYLGRIMYDKFLELLHDFEPDIIIPVPLNINRSNERGYNQTIELLNYFESHKDIIDNNVLVRVKDTPHQASLPKAERKENVKGAFVVEDASKVKNKNVLIVDDIFTSGATIDECAKMLKKAGASRVYSITLANSHEDEPLKNN